MATEKCTLLAIEKCTLSGSSREGSKATGAGRRWFRRAMAIRALVWKCLCHRWSGAGLGGFDSAFGFAG